MKRAPFNHTREDSRATPCAQCKLLMDENPEAYKSPHELWRQAGGDHDEYIRLMKKAGHVLERVQPDPVPFQIRCPKCRAGHNRGFIDGIRHSRCLRCGLVWDTKDPPVFDGNGGQVYGKNLHFDFTPACAVCGKTPTHGEHFYDGALRGGLRWWCDKHVPMSGHYEDCPTPCRELVAKYVTTKVQNEGKILTVNLTIGNTWTETYGKHPNAQLELLDENDHARVRVREGDLGSAGKASIFLTADELEDFAVRALRLSAKMRSRP